MSPWHRLGNAAERMLDEHDWYVREVSAAIGGQSAPCLIENCAAARFDFETKAARFVEELARLMGAT